MANRKDDWADKLAWNLWVEETPIEDAAKMIRSAAKREWARGEKRGAK